MAPRAAGFLAAVPSARRRSTLRIVLSRRCRRRRPGRRQRPATYRFPCPMTGRFTAWGHSQLVSRPRSRGGCRLRSHGGSQWRDGFPDPLGVSMGCGLHWFSGHLSDERGSGHQIECGIFQYWDLGGRHMAPKHPFGVRGQCLGRHGQQLSGVESGRHRKLPQNHRPRLSGFGGRVWPSMSPHGGAV